jgi:hypothetical protein
MHCVWLKHVNAKVATYKSNKTQHTVSTQSSQEDKRRPGTTNRGMDGEAYVRALNQWIAREGKRLSERTTQYPASLTLHHLYYLLSRFDDVLEVQTGPLNVRLQDIGEENHAHSADTYVSFSKRNSDAASIKSVSSIRSVMSTAVSSVWTGLGLWGGASRSEAQVTEDLKLLYSAFCKIPAIRLAPDKKLKPILGFEEYPFDTCVPLNAFKNLQCLEVFDYPVTALTGWDELSEQLRSLVIKRAGLVDVAQLTKGVIQDEHERKRRKAERATRHWQTLNAMDNSVRPGYESRSNSANGHLTHFHKQTRRRVRDLVAVAADMLLSRCHLHYRPINGAFYVFSV